MVNIQQPCQYFEPLFELNGTIIKLPSKPTFKIWASYFCQTNKVILTFENYYLELFLSD